VFPLFIKFLLVDVWEPLSTGDRVVADLGSERSFLFPPGNWIDDYPFIVIDGVSYYYP